MWVWTCAQTGAMRWKGGKTVMLSSSGLPTISLNKYLKTEDKNLHTGYHENPYRNESIGYGLDTEKIFVRVTKIGLKTGETEVLVSSLFDMDNVGTAQMKVLYGLRWPIEEGFKKLKPKMKLEQFGCRKPDGIFQEFEAHIFMMNLVALLGIQAQQQIDMNKKRKLNYKYNWQNAFRFVRK
ncbi:MAG: hypothetical protein EOO88_62095, partial [Pedobacter sp.]